MVRIDAGLVQDDQGSAGDAVWDHAALVQAPPWKTVFGFLPGIATKPSWNPFKAGCRSGHSSRWFSGFRRFLAVLRRVAGNRSECAGLNIGDQCDFFTPWCDAVLRAHQKWADGVIFYMY